MTFSDKTRVKSRNPCYFLLKKAMLNQGPCRVKPCYPGTPCTTNDLDAVGMPDVNAQWAQVLSKGAFLL